MECGDDYLQRQREHVQLKCKLWDCEVEKGFFSAIYSDLLEEKWNLSQCRKRCPTYVSEKMGSAAEPLHFELTQHNGTMSWDHITFEIFDGVTRKYSNKLECSAV